MDRRDRSGMIAFFTEQPLTADARVELDDAAAAHARVRRERVGAPARLLDGRGCIASGEIVELAKGRVAVRIAEVSHRSRLASLEVLVPVADRDRMLLAAEKCAELEVSSWRPVVYARSRSVNPRGEGARFRDRIKARMRAALEQSGAAWLPEVHDEMEFGAALAAIEEPARGVLLDSSGLSLSECISNHSMALAIGPEGGFEARELRAAAEAGWRIASLTRSTLRFETAVIAGVAVVRAFQHGGG